MTSARPLQLRWVWVSTYLIAGCLATAIAAGVWLDGLHLGAFYFGFAGAGFAGAVIATAHSRGARSRETGIAAVLVGLLHLLMVLFESRPSTEAIAPYLSEPLSSAFVCFAGALAGSRLTLPRRAAFWFTSSRARLVVSSLLVMVGATYAHFEVIVFVSAFSEALSLGAGILLMFATPSLAIYVLQLVTKEDLTTHVATSFLLGASVVVAAFYASGASVIASLWISFMLFVFGGITYVLTLPGLTVGKTSPLREDMPAAPLPEAIVRSPSHTQ